MQWSDDVTVETPEQIDVSLELAGLGSRFVAWVLDFLLLLGVWLSVGLILLVIVGLLGQNAAETAAPMLLVALGVVLFFATQQGYDIFFEVRHNGQTPGKRFAGIRVLREGGGPIDFRSSAIRNLLRVADMLPALYLLGGLLVLISGRNQRLGDLAAGTLVTRERASAPPSDWNAEIERYASQEITFTAEQLAGCSAQDRHVLRSFFQRWQDMDGRPRRLLAQKLTDEYLRKTAYPVADANAHTWTDESFLASLFRDLKALDQHER